MSKKQLKVIENQLQENPKMSIDTLLEVLKDLAHMNLPADRTIAHRYSSYKKFIREHFERFTEEDLKKIKPSKEIIDNIVSADSERRTNKQNIKFNKTVVQKLLDLEKSTRVVDLVIYLMFVSGRRLNEIVLDKYPLGRVNTKKNTVIFNSLSKQKEKKPAVVHLLEEVEPSYFKKLLKMVRNKLFELDLNVNDVTSKVNKRLKSMKDVPFISSHNLRGAYATYLYHQSGKKQNINGFLTKVLNHDSDETSLSYSNYLFLDEK